MISTIREETFQDKEVVFEEGSEERAVYIIKSGAVKIMQSVNNEMNTVEILREGDIFGEMAFIALIPRTATAMAVGETVLGIIDPEALRSEMTGLPPMAQRLMESLVVQMKKATANSMGISFLRNSPRVIKTLSLAFSKDNALFDAFSRDVSCIGVFIKTSSLLHKGEVFMLNVILPDGGDPMKIKSRVIWVRPETTDEKNEPVGMGVEFMNIPVESQRRIMSFIKKDE